LNENQRKENNKMKNKIKKGEKRGFCQPVVNYEEQ